MSKKSKMLISIGRQVAIAGQVLDAETKKPIGGVEVKIETENKKAPPSKFISILKIKELQYGERWQTMSRRLDRVYTAPDGSFYFVDLPDDTYTLKASLPGSGTRYGTVTSEPLTVSSTAEKVTVEMKDGKIVIVNGKTNRNEQSSDNLNVKLELRPTTLKGTIRSKGELVVMAKVRVQGSGEYAFTDAKGKYCLTGLEKGRHTVAVFFQGKRKSSKSVSLKIGEVVEDLDFTIETTNQSNQ